MVTLSARAESAPPTRGYEQVMPLPKAKVKKAKSKQKLPPTTPIRKNPKPAHNNSKRPKRMLRRDPLTDRCSLAMSRTESVLVGSSGDVIVCRCRRSSTPYMSSSRRSEAFFDPWVSNLMPCCDADGVACISEGPWSPAFENLTVQEPQNHVFGEASQVSEASTYEWEKLDRSKHVLAKPTTNIGSSKRKNSHNNGLKGGAAPMRDTARASSPPEVPTLSNLQDFNAYDGGILPLPSFDYSHIHEGMNDMLVPSKPVKVEDPIKSPRVKSKQPVFPTIVESPEDKQEDETDTPTSGQPFFHGVPVFLSTLSQIRITKVSAHPLGAHVLLISAEALLFTYGLNNHGQLGIGIQSHIKDDNRGFHTTPTLITPLLENGGKAINCAAGVDHSLVVVATEGRRLQKLQTSPDVAYSDHGALPLSRVPSSPSRLSNVGYDDGEDLRGGASDESLRHHQIYGFGSNDFMKIGLVSATLADDGAEGDIEDILLPRRVALHCTVWPSKDDATTGTAYPPHGVFDIAASTEHSSALVRRATGDIEVYMWGNATLGALGLEVTQNPDIKVKGGTTRRPTSNANNIFPLPTVVEGLSYRPNREAPLGFPRQISLGPYCSLVTMSTGRCMSFGFSAEGMLGQGYGVTHTMEPKEVFLPEAENGIVSVSAGAFHAIAVTENGQAFAWGINSDDRLGLGTVEFVKQTSHPNASQSLVAIEWVPQKIDIAHDSTTRVVQACAGYDSSMMVVKTGQVLCFGKRSGRLGKGEVAKDVSVPQPLYGGLRLFYQQQKGAKRPNPKKMPLIRIQSEGAFAI